MVITTQTLKYKSYNYINKLRRSMNSDINQAKSRAFNVLLRFFQLGLSLCATFFVTLIYKSCLDKSFEIIRVTGITMACINVLGMLYLKFKVHHPKTGFLALYSLNIIGCLIIIIYAAANLHGDIKCPTKTMLYEYYLGIVPLYFVLSLMILTLPFFWVQRFSNSPGIIVWPIILFVQATKTTNLAMIEVIGILGFLVNLMTWSTNGLALIFGVSTTLKKIIVACFIAGIFLTGINELLALIGIANTKQTTTKGFFTKNLFQTFMLDNLVDILFWLVGLYSLQYQNGDSIRDSLFQYGLKEQNKVEVEEEVPEGVYGTLQ